MAAALSAIKVPASPTVKKTMADALKAATAAETENKPLEPPPGEQLVNCFSMEWTSKLMPFFEHELTHLFCCILNTNLISLL